MIECQVALAMGDEKKANKPEDEDEEDPRLEFMFNYFSKSMKIKQERWNKLIANEEFLVNLSIIHIFALHVNLSVNRQTEIAE